MCDRKRVTDRQTGIQTPKKFSIPKWAPTDVLEINKKMFFSCLLLNSTFNLFRLLVLKKIWGKIPFDSSFEPGNTRLVNRINEFLWKTHNSFKGPEKKDFF